MFDARCAIGYAVEDVFPHARPPKLVRDFEVCGVTSEVPTSERRGVELINDDRSQFFWSYVLALVKDQFPINGKVLRELSDGRRNGLVVGVTDDLLHQLDSLVCILPSFQREPFTACKEECISGRLEFLQRWGEEAQFNGLARIEVSFQQLRLSAIQELTSGFRG